ncbi:NUDIX hydrolase domain-like protein [Zychaea mexicana]|uniref:NUDIX hydrolase domain-like protein n=1 Tax=Zychaea mexicana TaxID=64656 RepID=UPI0022FF3B66|nr:NUDIX hydrolase domain-like protein [Zychaea mexicana]KAI9489474.1 NUDIX hydrolase domain-like protein [Zychaea mexicana]
MYRPVAAIIVTRRPTTAAAVSAANNNNNNTGNVQALTRKLSEPLYLFVKKPRRHNAWQFPQGGIDDGETVSQAVLRELAEECGTDIKVKLIDQEQPCCTYQYRFPPDFVRHKRSNFVGAKVEFIRAEWIEGQCQPDGHEIVDFAWLTRHELDDHILNPEYKSLISRYME